MLYRIAFESLITGFKSSGNYCLNKENAEKIAKELHTVCNVIQSSYAIKLFSYSNIKLKRFGIDFNEISNMDLLTFTFVKIRKFIERQKCNIEMLIQPEIGQKDLRLHMHGLIKCSSLRVISDLCKYYTRHFGICNIKPYFVNETGLTWHTYLEKQHEFPTYVMSHNYFSPERPNRKSGAERPVGLEGEK